MKFLIDANLPPAMADWLREAGHEARHVRDALSLTAPDEAVWSEALTSGAIVVTKDADYLALAARDPSGRLVLVRCGNLTLSVLAGWFAARLAAMTALLDLGEHIVELR